MMKKFYEFWCLLYIIKIVDGTRLELKTNCLAGQYYEPGLLRCQACPANSSLVTSADGDGSKKQIVSWEQNRLQGKEKENTRQNCFGCKCEDHSVPIGINRCKQCNATEMVSADGTMCVPRRCQNTAGRFVCRKCPNDYISVTQNIEGSPLKEVQCVKCSRGYRAESNVCVRCEACICSKQQIIVSGICIPKNYLDNRPKYEENSLHPRALLDAVKHEYLCMQNDSRACRILAGECVRNFYSIDPAGPCRLWIQRNISTPKDLPPLTVESSLSDKYPGETNLPRGKDFLIFAAAVYTPDAGMKFLKDADEQTSRCNLPVNVRIGYDFEYDCNINVSKKIIDYMNATISPYLYADNNLIQIPVYPRKPNGYNLQKGPWQSKKFKRYFIMDKSLSTTTNATITVYLQTMLIKIQVEREKNSQGSLKIYVSIEVDYATKSQLSDTIVMSLKVTHIMPEAGVHRGLEIWGGVLGAISALYAMVQWRGVVRRGGLYLTVVPLLAASIADTLYFATWFSTLHALAAEAGTLGLTLPLADSEEYTIKILIYAAASLKAVKVACFNFNQCRCDVFFLDWSEYNPPFKETCTTNTSNNWRAMTLAREWSRLQTIRRVSPDLTAVLALIILHLFSSWQSYLPQNMGYKWAVATIAWWSSYIIILLLRWITDRLVGSPITVLPKICTNVGLSLLVFEEEYYAHYVHGRNDDSKDLRSMPGQLATCRVVCAPQLRSVYKQLSLSMPGLEEIESKQALLSRFLGTFFERALDGLSWVACERTILERLLDVELTSREAGNTSTLLYDPDDCTPSCFKVTWWGEEWSLCTFDAMIFSCVLVAADNVLLATLVTLLVWQIMKLLRRCFGKKNQREKTDIEI